MEIKLPSQVSEIIDILQNAGFDAYCVGGAVRDSIMGFTPDDWDITTGATPDKTRSLFKNYKTIDTGLQHGTVTVIISGKPLEITTFRQDGTYTDLRHPKSMPRL